MNNFDKLIDDSLVFISIRIVSAHKPIQFIGIFDNIKAENISAVNVASSCENHFTAVIYKRTEETVICYIEIVDDDKRVASQTFQKTDMLCKSGVFIVGKAIPCKIHIGYHLIQTAVVIEIQNISVFFLVFLCVCFGKFALAYTCKTRYEYLVVLLKCGM